MLSCKVKTLYLLLSSLVLFKLNCGLSLSRSKRSPLEIDVLSPSEFDVHLPQGTLLNFRVNINKALSEGEAADFEKNGTDGTILHFSRDGLKLKKGDYIYYHGLFETSDGFQGEEGVYIFTGGFKGTKKQKREITEKENQEELNPEAVESGSSHHRERRYGPPHGHHFGPPPFHSPPCDSPHGHPHGHFHSHARGHPHGGPPGHWNGYGHGHGYGHRDKFGPWNNHGDDGKGFERDGPWNRNKNKWGDVDSNTVSPGGGNKDNNNGNSGSEVEVTTKSVVAPKPSVTSTTTTTTATPEIDIRFPDVE